MHHECVQRAVALGRGTDPAVLPELAGLLKMPSAEIRRLAASAIGKLSGFGTDPVAAVAALAPAALRDPHPQVQQYALTAMKAYGTAAVQHLADIRDLAENPKVKDYVRKAAASAASVIVEAQQIAAKHAVRTCLKCGMEVSADEYARSWKAFQRAYCDKCFDEVYLERRNFDTKVELNKTIETKPGTLVQSDGERLIAEWLASNRIAYRYDERFRIVEGYAIRPDFYLPEFDVYIEYWGMDTADYKIGMLKKQKLYQQEGKRVISLYPADKPRMAEVVRDKLRRYARLPAVAGGGESVSLSVGNPAANCDSDHDRQ
ncbi:MAG: hypothetical protein ACOYOU_17235 [Kiritimatiellia bacterium]